MKHARKYLPLMTYQWSREFLMGIKELTGKTVHIADKGMVLDFDKTPF